MPISDEDAALFREMTEGVRPLKTDDRVNLKPARPQPKNIQHTQAHSSSNPYGSHTPPLDPSATVTAEEALFYLQGSLPHTTLQKLKRGALCSDLELDLHGLNVQQATEELQQLLQEALLHNIRCFQVIHGKGNQSSEQIPVLKNWVNQWLQHQSKVLAFCSARQRDGGTGALYVLLKRNPLTPDSGH